MTKVTSDRAELWLVLVHYKKSGTGLSDEEGVNFVRPKKIVIKKNAKKNDTKNRNGQI